MKPILKIVKQQTIKEWVANKMVTNPKLYGGDNGTNAITKVYLKKY
jgi:hypothetical protein